MDAIVKKEWFTDWLDSPYYRLLYDERKEREKDTFIDNLIQYLHLRPGAALLDAGCGRGLHAEYLADRGFEVTGIDLSEKNIKAARRMENDHLDFFCHDMRMPFRVNYYDVAFNLFDRFGYFGSRRDNDNALRSVSGAVRKNGLLVMDYLNSPFVKEHLTDHEVKVIEGVEFDIHRQYKDGYFLKNIHISDVIHMQELSFTEKAAAFTLQDFREMLARHRMEIVHLFGDYHLNPYDAGLSPRLVLIAKKI